MRNSLYFSFKQNAYTIFVVAWLSIIAYLALNGRLTTIWQIGFSLTLTLVFLYSAIKPLLSHTVTKEFISFFQLPDFTSQVGQLPVYQLQVKELASLCLKDNKRLLFVVDDLDRCSPEGITKVFEAIRLVMDINNVAVIIAIDHRIALSALAHQYRDLAEKGNGRNRFDIARDYLGKIIQLPINLDTPDRSMVRSYVDSLFEGNLEQIGLDEEGLIENKKTNEIQEQSKEQSILQQQNSGNDLKKKETNLETPNVPTGNPVSDDKNNKLNQTMLHSDQEKTHFTSLSRLLDFHNPRQLKRLHSSYRLLRAYEKTEEDTNLKYMCALFFLEFIRNQQSNIEDKPEEILLSYFKKPPKEKDSLYSYLLEHFESEEEYFSIKEIIKPFVLPRAKL